MNLLHINIDKIIDLCKKYRVVKLWAFGSILTDKFSDQSDVDLLVVFDRTRIALLDLADVFFDFIEEMEAVIGRRVDLTDYSAITNRFFKEEVDEKKQLLWSAI